MAQPGSGTETPRRNPSERGSDSIDWWSWKGDGFDVITYRNRDWQRRAFEEVTGEVGGRQVKYPLGERLLRVAGFRVRARCDARAMTATRPRW